MSVTDTPRRDPVERDLTAAPSAPQAKAGRRPRPRIAFPLTARILAINVMALGVLVAGFFYLDHLQRDLMDAKLDALAREATLLAAALGDSAVDTAGTSEPGLDRTAAATLVHRLSLPIDTRALLFDADGTLAVDSWRLPMAPVQTTELPPPDEDRGVLGRAADAAYEWITARLPPRTTVPLHTEPSDPRADDLPKVLSALQGTAGQAMQRTADARLVAVVAAPIQPFRRVQGALLLVADAEDVLESVRNARFTILQAFCIALGITILLSLFFAGTITRPVRRLARAAERVRAGGGRKVAIPDFTARNDEIGRLSAALRDMTEALWVRMDAIERFVADVAHEVKNPLSSVLSAVDTARRVDDEEKRAKLLALVGEDVKRLDRLLSQIADASKIDTELARAQLEPVDIRAMLTTLAEMQGAAASASDAPAATTTLEIEGEGPFAVLGVEDRLAQVLQNLVGNARSFSPPGGTVALGLRRDGAGVVVSVDDDGPGVPAGMEEAIFRRFYTFRPEGETFGAHSGLGLSISRQIAEAHGGRLACTNRYDSAGRVLGASFRLELPAAAPARSSEPG
ncbi:MAG: stimulus-sensing domain-containing protein [Rhodospirillales bacterium]|nr:stimulus-sensing domain-containing protein [Rhodospirillales bacterium]MDE0381119.1 stimulus-sensing domain-containing protein [Rhodospirillales bacterium]